MEPGHGHTLVTTGIPGLDDLLQGGLPEGGLYLVQGDTGTGKTVASLQFLQRHAADGKRCLFLTLSEPKEGIARAADSLGWSLDGIVLHQLSSGHREELEARQVIFDRSELEMDEVVGELLDVVARHQADVVVFDAISHLRLLTDDELTYRQAIVALRDFFSSRQATVIVTDNYRLAPGRGELADLATGVIELSRRTDDYGIEKRTVEIIKIRGHHYRSGIHDLVIDRRGVTVAPRLTHETPLPAGGSIQQSEMVEISSGNDNLDRLVGGGLKTGTSTAFIGPSGAGKTSTASLYAIAAAERHGGALVYLFEETQHAFLARSNSLNLPVERLVNEGKMRLRHVATASLSPGTFATTIARDLDETGARAVLIDSLTGYLNAMTNAKMLETHMHDLLMYLSARNVLSMLVVAQHGLLGTNLHDPVDVSYMADAVLLLRHFEHGGELRRAISVFKKRYGAHEHRIRELLLSDRGVGAASHLVGFENLLSGAPTLVRGDGGDGDSR